MWGEKCLEEGRVSVCRDTQRVPVTILRGGLGKQEKNFAYYCTTVLQIVTTVSEKLGGGVRCSAVG